MGMMVSEVYDVLVSAGASEDKARAAAIAVSPIAKSEEQWATQKDIAEIKSELKVLKWMLGIVIVATVVPALKTLFIP
jgi:ABC-type maltose transport system permease subunit